MSILRRWFGAPVRPQVHSEQLIARVSKSLAFPSVETQPGLWSVIAAPLDTYRVSLFLWAQERLIHLMASSEARIERDLLPRELMLLLLEENHRSHDGAFRLACQNDDRLVAFGTTVDTRFFPENELKALAETLIERMQRMVHRLHAMGLIIDGPHPIKKDQQPHY